MISSASVMAAQLPPFFYGGLGELWLADVQVVRGGQATTVFAGSEFKATAAYVVSRGEPMHVGVGYWGSDGQYEGIAIDKADRLMQQALVMSSLG